MSDDDREFRELVRFAIHSLEGDSPSQMYKMAAAVVREAVGRDSAKLYALIDVVHGRISNPKYLGYYERNQILQVSSRPTYVPSFTLTLYVPSDRTFFTALDLEFINGDNPTNCTATGDEVVLRTITEKCVDQLDRHSDWSVAPSCFAIEFVEEVFREGVSLISDTAVSNVITRMTESHYLFFDKNLDMLLNLIVRVVPRIQKLVHPGRPAQVGGALQRLRAREPEGSIEQAGNTELVVDAFSSTISEHVKRAEREDEDLAEAMQDIDIAVVAREDIEREAKLGLALLDQNPHWSCQSVRRIIDGIQKHVTIGASLNLENAAYRAIDSMVKSDMLSERMNLQTLAIFLLRVGPVLDAMSTPSPSLRLTSLLGSLKYGSREGTSAHERDIDALCQNLGRAYILDMGTTNADTSNTDTSNADAANVDTSTRDQGQADDDKAGATPPV